jgi:hypothetical protein
MGFWSIYMGIYGGGGVVAVADETTHHTLFGSALTRHTLTATATTRHTLNATSETRQTLSGATP